MIDDQAQVTALMDKMKQKLPIPVRPSDPLIRLMRKQGVKLASNQDLQIKEVIYGGDEGGILCDVTQPGSKEALVCSLTHLRVSGRHPLAGEIRAYQLARKKRLAQGG